MQVIAKNSACRPSGSYSINHNHEHKLSSKAISCEEYTQLIGLFVHSLRCKNSFIARYAPIFTPRQLLLRCSTSCIHAVVELIKNPV